MRLINVVFIVLVGLALAFMGNLYLANHDVFVREVVIYQGERIKVQTLILVVFSLGFFLNLIYAGIMELTRLVRGLNASAATRLGKRLGEHVQDARNLVAHGMYKDAQSVLEGILKERADHTAANLLLAEVYLKLGQPDLAVSLLEALIQAHPALVEPRYQLAEALVAARHSDAAALILKRIATDHPKLGLRALRRLRALQIDAHQWNEALETHKKLMSQFGSELGPGEKGQSQALTFQVALLKVEADQFKEASQSFQQILKEDALFVPAYLNLGRCMILQDQEAQGLEIWLEGFRTTGEGSLLQEIEDYYIQCGKPEEGLAVMRKVAATSSHATLAKFFLGKMLYRLEILDEALEQFQEVRAQVVYSPILYFFIAKIHGRRGRLNQSLSEYRELLRHLGVLKLRYQCEACGHTTVDYSDRCDHCGTWNSVHFLFKENDLPDSPLRPETGSWLAFD